MSAKKHYLVFDYLLGGYYASSFTVVGIGLVEWRFYCSYFIQPFRVGGEGGKFLEIRLVLRPVHMIKLPLFIAQINVYLVRKPAAVCK